MTYIVIQCNDNDVSISYNTHTESKTTYIIHINTKIAIITFIVFIFY